MSSIIPELLKHHLVYGRCTVGVSLCELQSGLFWKHKFLNSAFQKMKMASKESEIRELIIGGFSRAVNANTEPGLKHCLNYAYDANLRTRATFARIFARVLLAGTRFDAPGSSPAPPKQSILCEVSSFLPNCGSGSSDTFAVGERSRCECIEDAFRP